MPPSELATDQIEQTKLTATYLNGLAIAVFAVGALAPSIAFLNGAAYQASLRLSAEVAVCLSASVILHAIGRRFLRRLSS